MRRTKQTTALALTGAVALASGAYALGSQAGDGSAEAAKPSASAPQGYGGRPFPGPPGRWRGGPPDLQSLADRLGVKESDLQAALEDVRKSLPAPQERRDDLAQELADALGIGVDKVKSAFDKVRPQRPAHPRRGSWCDGPHPARPPRPDTAALAKALGVTQAELRAAFDKLRAAHQGDRDKLRDQLAQQLADRLHVSVDKVKDALDDFGPRFGGRHP